MDYEKLHRDTITKLQEMVNSGKITAEIARGICADFVTESEDERIRKAIKLMYSFLPNKPKYIGDVSVEDMFAWLEKQGENHIVGNNEMVKPIDKVEQKSAVLIPKFHVGDKLVSTKNPSLTYEILEVGHINELGNPEYKVEIFTDGKVGNPRNIHYMECYKVDEWAKLIEQKPAWSEEDETIIDNLVWAIANDKIRPQDRDDYCDWLKSLKPQKQWKPSDEQIRRLEYFVKSWGKTEDTENTKVFETVKSLLNDLKQLKQL